MTIVGISTLAGSAAGRGRAARIDTSASAPIVPICSAAVWKAWSEAVPSIAQKRCTIGMGQGREQSERAGAKPGGAVGDDQPRAEKLGRDDGDVDRDRRLQSELPHLGDSAGEIDQLVKPAAPERECEDDAHAEFERT